MSTLVSTTSGGQVRRCRKRYTFMYDRAFLLGHCPSPPESEYCRMGSDSENAGVQVSTLD